MISTLTFIVAALACTITFLVARRVFQHQLQIGPPNLLAATVAALAFLGLTSHSRGLFSVLLLPYEVLALSLALLFLMFYFSAWICKTRKRRRTFVMHLPKASRRCQRHIAKAPLAGGTDPQKRPTGLREPPPPK